MKTLHGARLLVFVNGRAFGKTSQIDYEISAPHKELETIDSVLPFELMPTRVRVRGSMRCYRLAGDAGAEGAGMQGVAQLVARERYFSVLVVDRLTDLVVFRADYCSLNGQSWTAAVKSLMGGNLSFSGLTATNELGTPR